MSAQRRAIAARGLVAVALLAPALAAAQATLGVKGDVLRGRVVDLTPEGVEFAPIHGEGRLVVEWADVESLETDASHAVMHGDAGEAHGRVLGFIGGRWLLVGDAPETAQRIDVGSLFHAFGSEEFDGSLRDRLRSRYRYWTASLDAGAAITDGTTDQALAFAALRIDRKRAPTHWLLEGAARYATEKERGEPRGVTENVIWGLARGERDLGERWFGYGSVRAAHDAEQKLSLRLEPRAGVGVHVEKSPARNLSTDVGVAWIYEDFFGDEPVPGAAPLDRSRGHENYWSIAFGAQADAELPFGAVWRARAEYLPAVDDWVRDYLARAETSIDFPLLEWLAFKVAVADEYDNTPAPGASQNKLTTTASLSLRFP